MLSLSPLFFPLIFFDLVPPVLTPLFFPPPVIRILFFSKQISFDVTGDSFRESFFSSTPMIFPSPFFSSHGIFPPYPSGLLK